ncbi:MAG: DASS family sodium-coupled anion symporter [Betaproteobacteria bacterium]|nr:DASS family sodium-coupled anion symporter [Betaproteobacteria bacterium]
MTPRAARFVRRGVLFAGPVLALATFLALPESYAAAPGKEVAFTAAGRATLAMVVWMAAWWMTEAVDIEVTALLPIALFPLLGIATIAKATEPYASDVIYLFLGGFVLGLAIERWGLDRRIAFHTLRITGPRPGAMVAGFMAATAFLSMWISNTACAAMMVPIAVSVIDLVLRSRTGKGLRESGGIPQDRKSERNFALCLLLAVAYAASIGGIGTIIGSPPNGIASRFIAQTYGKEVTFLDWMTFGMPFTLVFLPIAWVILTRVLFPVEFREVPGGREMIAAEIAKLGPMNRGEKATLAVFAAAAFFWIFGGLLRDLDLGGIRPLRGLTDSGVAMLAALALFLLPVERDSGKRAMDWDTASRLPWGVLVLFGGGLSLAAAVEANGVSGFIGQSARALAVLPPLGLLVAIIAMTVFLSEVTSNTAQVATMTPVLAAMAPALGLDPKTLVVVCALAASSAYMMPVGTPPNAIVFGTGLVRMPQMVKAGFVLNLAGIAVIAALAWWVIPHVVAAH